MTTSEAEIAAAKRALRKQWISRRDAMAAGERAAAAAAIAAHGIGFAAPGPRAAVSAYSAMGSEIDPAALLARLAGEGLETCLPVIQPLGNPLRFRAWRSGEPLVAGTWGIQEPADTAPLVEPDILLVPLLAFDRRGMRLGYGGGYYDRTLSRLRSTKTVVAVGLAFSSQEAEDLPCNSHDERLDCVLTETGPRAFA